MREFDGNTGNQANVGRESFGNSNQYADVQLANSQMFAKPQSTHHFEAEVSQPPQFKTAIENIAHQADDAYRMAAETKDRLEFENKSRQIIQLQDEKRKLELELGEVRVDVGDGRRP